MRFQIYKHDKNEFRWKLEGNNKRVIAESAEGYKTERACVHAINLLKYLAAHRLSMRLKNRESGKRGQTAGRVAWGL